jgi:hypothetical protein
MADADEAQARIAAELAKKAAKERLATLKSDTDRLLKLSVELKQSVDKSDENVLSLDVVKKAEEIEKLARSVKEKMKGRAEKARQIIRATTSKRSIARQMKALPEQLLVWRDSTRA